RGPRSQLRPHPANLTRRPQHLGERGGGLQALQPLQAEPYTGRSRPGTARPALRAEPGRIPRAGQQQTYPCRPDGLPQGTVLAQLPPAIDHDCCSGSGEEILDKLEEGLRLFAVHPVAGTGDDLGARTGKMLQDGVAVLDEDVVGIRALDEQHCSLELLLPPGPADDVAEGAADHWQVEAPAEAAVCILLQIGEQEVAYAFVAHVALQYGIGILARGEFFRPYRTQSLEHVHVATWIGHWRDVHHHQAPHPRGLVQGYLHGCLA